MFQQLLKLTLADIRVLFLSIHRLFQSLQQVHTAIKQNAVQSHTREDGVVSFDPVQCENPLQGNTRFWRSKRVSS